LCIVPGPSSRCWKAVFTRFTRPPLSKSSRIGRSSHLKEQTGSLGHLAPNAMHRAEVVEYPDEIRRNVQNGREVVPDGDVESSAVAQSPFWLCGGLSTGDEHHSTVM
jgi:hypothetical protein